MSIYLWIIIGTVLLAVVILAVFSISYAVIDCFKQKATPTESKFIRKLDSLEIRANKNGDEKSEQMIHYNLSE